MNRLGLVLNSILVTLFILFTSACVSHLQYGNFPQSVVKILQQSKSGHGTGFLIDYNDRQIVMSAKHVLKNGKFIVNGHNLVDLVTSENLDTGFAYLNTSSSIGPSLPIRCSEVTLGEEIIAVGYPLEFPLVSSWGHVIAVNYKDADGKGFLADITINMGQSGGPVFDTDGKVVGVISAYALRPTIGFGGYSRVYESADIALIVPMSEICKEFNLE